MLSAENNPDPSCNKECRFTYGPTMTTAMYYAPIYDKNGVNINPDMNTTYGEVSCIVCGRSWYSSTRGDVTEFKLIER